MNRETYEQWKQRTGVSDEQEHAFFERSPKCWCGRTMCLKGAWIRTVVSWAGRTENVYHPPGCPVHG